MEEPINNEEAQNQPAGIRSLVEGAIDMLGLSDWVTYSNVVKNALFLAFLVGLGVLHVANTHLAERTVRKINQRERDLKELRWEYMTLKSNLMYERQQSEMAEKLSAAGLEELREPPRKIIVDKRAY